jgi:NAD(P)-dependent dehydrogenase (short-subunit alcohol dehydrogenase family)
MSDSLAGKRAVVTGATTGIGFAVAKALIRAGGRVLITGQNAERVATANRELGANAIGVVADCRSLADIRQAMRRAQETLGQVDVLVANAGVTWPSKIEDVSESSFDDQMAINVRGVFFSIQQCLPLMTTGGSIVMTSSCMDAKGYPEMAVYSASKAAVRSLVRSLAAELADRRIRVNSVAPGPIDTPIFDKLASSRAVADKARRDEANETAMKRLGSADEVANAVLFLAGDQASYVTGANLRVDGGWTDL